MFRTGILFGLVFFASAAIAADDVSVEEGLRIATIGGCHDCHTDGFAASGGQVDPEKALRGSQVGFQGPWGTTYPANLRIVLSKMGEDEFVRYSREIKTRPPMPWFGLHAMTDNELKSFYRYVKSLGEPGALAPDYVKPGEAPKTPFIVFAPPQMPAQ
ncbi:cytochrome C [Pseudaminobacter arsenicus]|uniref:Cytochrome C n=1 Tax=Borborobacter arsenicus TaxID=1851146 RepID=A0A432V2F5_9HYPH|nr:cytochrome C [Pseudaminobacter arsenicus]RUM96351.1 cytochrome C [Pseudaminobacter arsenicus]